MTDGFTTWTDLWAECTDRLGSSDEARHIIEQASGRAGASWLITLTTQAPLSSVDSVHSMVERRLAGEPLQYVLGRWGFRQLDLVVDKRVLIPRPETEMVVDAAIDSLSEVSNATIADLGTGSGAIALSLAKEIFDAQVWATDVSVDALEVAEINSRALPTHALERLHLQHGSWFEALPEEYKGKFDLIISNPPYVAETDRATLDASVTEWEPEGALFAGPDGTDALRHIVDGAFDWLAPGGAVIVELGPEQAEAMCASALARGYFSVGVGKDLAQRKRWVTASKSAARSTA